MVTLRPGHPHPLATARAADRLDGFVPFVRSVLSINRPGRHRIRMAWNSYRSRHEDRDRTGPIRFMPNWGHPQPSPELPTDTRSGPEGTPTVEVPAMTDPLPVVREFSHTVTDLEPTSELPLTPNGEQSQPRSNGSAATAPGTDATTAFSSVPAPLIETAVPVLAPERPSRPPARVLHRSRLLPLAHPREGSSLAALLGFGAKEATFGGDLTKGNGRNPPSAPADDPWMDFPSLSTVTAELKRRGNTGDTVKLLWDATAELDLGRDLLPAEPDATRLPFRSPRRICWSLVISCALLMVLTAATVKVISDLPAREAEARQRQYAQATGRLQAAVNPIASTLSAGGLLTDSGLSTLTSQVSVLDTAARSSSTLAFEPLPKPPIIGSSLSVDELIVPKQLLESASLQAVAVSERMDDAMSYSLALSNAFSIPALPAAASPEELDRITEELSFTIAETRLILTGLPDDPLFGTFRQQAFDTVGALEAMQADYVTALREGDTEAAAGAGTEIEEYVTAVRDRIHSPLEQVQSWALGQIVEIRATLSDIESLVEG